MDGGGRQGRNGDSHCHSRRHYLVRSPTKKAAATTVRIGIPLHRRNRSGRNDGERAQEVLRAWWQVGVVVFTLHGSRLGSRASLHSRLANQVTTTASVSLPPVSSTSLPLPRREVEWPRQEPREQCTTTSQENEPHGSREW